MSKWTTLREMHGSSTHFWNCAWLKSFASRPLWTFSFPHEEKVEKHDSVEIWLAIAAVTMKHSAVPGCHWPTVLLICQSGRLLPPPPHYSNSLYGNWMEFRERLIVLFTVRMNSDRMVCIVTKSLLDHKGSALRSHQMCSQKSAQLFFSENIEIDLNTRPFCTQCCCVHTVLSCTHTPPCACCR